MCPALGTSLEQHKKFGNYEESYDGSKGCILITTRAMIECASMTWSTLHRRNFTAVVYLANILHPKVLR